MSETKCITFDKAAQDALPEHIKTKMHADKMVAKAIEFCQRIAERRRIRKKYRMTDEELRGIIDASKGFPCIMCGVDLGESPQERANNAWKVLAKKYHFRWDSAGGAGTDPHEFYALPE